MITVEKATVHLTEQTVRELYAAIAAAKQDAEFIDDPMPACDMSEDQYEYEQRRRGIIKVSSCYSETSFRIALETKPNTQESCGYCLVEAKKPKSGPQVMFMRGTRKGHADAD